MEAVTIGADGRARCGWAGSDADYVVYHDTEWGFGFTDDRRLFEKLCLEGFQSGLSWLTILRKRDAFRAAFARFDPEAVAAFGETDVERLVADASIVRHRGKIVSAINNAARAIELQRDVGSLEGYFATHLDDSPEAPAEVPATTAVSTAIAKDLKRRGWSFVGPTTVYAFMQAAGLVNDHAEACWVRDDAQRARLAAWRAVSPNSAARRRGSQGEQDGPRSRQIR